MTDYEYINELTGLVGEEAIDSMISDASNSNNYDVFKFTFSTTDIAKEYSYIDTANQLNYILKKINILSQNGELSKFTIDNKFGLVFHGTNKKGEKYSQIRYTKEGKDYILKSDNQKKPIDSKATKKIKDVEIRYICHNNDINENIEAYVIICFIENEEGIVYELNQKIKYNDVAESLVNKIIDKGVIDLRYWSSKKIEELSTDEIIYWTDSDFDFDFSDDYYDDSEAGDTKRMIDDVSNQLGYDVDEDLARAFVHDMSRN